MLTEQAAPVAVLANASEAPKFFLIVANMAKRNPEGSEMLTVQEAAERKGVTDVRVYQWLAEGRLTKHGKYGRTLVAVADLDALLELRRGP